MLNFFIIDRSRIPYQEKGFIRIKTVSFHSVDNITYSVFLKINFIVPISSIQLQISILTSFTQTKGTIQSVWSDLMTSILPHWLTPPLLFSLYIFVIPPGWFGRIRKTLHSKPSTLHPYSINLSFTNPNNKPLKTSPASRVGDESTEMSRNHLSAFSTSVVLLVKISLRRFCQGAKWRAFK